MDSSTYTENLCDWWVKCAFFVQSSKMSRFGVLMRLADSLAAGHDDMGSLRDSIPDFGILTVHRRGG